MDFLKKGETAVGLGLNERWRSVMLMNEADFMAGTRSFIYT